MAGSDRMEEEEVTTPTDDQSSIWGHVPGNSPSRDASARAGRGVSHQRRSSRLSTASNDQDLPVYDPIRPGSAAQRSQPETRSSRHSFPYSDAPTAVASTSPSLSAAAQGSTLSGPTLAGTVGESESSSYTLPPARDRTISRDGIRMYHLTLEELRQADLQRNQELAQLPRRQFPPPMNQIREAEREEGPVLGTEQEPGLNEDYAEALLAIEGGPGRSLRRRPAPTYSTTPSSRTHEEWGRSGRDGLSNQRWESPSDRH